MALVGCPWTVHAVAIALTRADIGQVPVPAERIDLWHRHPFLAAVRVQQARFHLLGDLGEEREVRADAVVSGAERIGLPRPYRQAHARNPFLDSVSGRRSLSRVRADRMVDSFSRGASLTPDLSSRERVREDVIELCELDDRAGVGGMRGGAGRVSTGTDRRPGCYAIMRSVTSGWVSSVTATAVWRGPP
jgi:hypothetical protein